MANFSPDAIDASAVATVQALLEQADKGHQTGANWETVVDILREHDLAEPVQLRPDHVGIHAANRSSFRSRGMARVAESGDSVLLLAGDSRHSCGARIVFQHYHRSIIQSMANQWPGNTLYILCV